MKSKLSVYLSFFVALSIFFISCKEKSETKETPNPDTYEVTAVKSTTSLCDSIWFPHSQTPPPAEGNGSPFDSSTSTNIIFHQWSWQKFLWVTKPMSSGKPLFEEQFTQVDNQMTPVQPIDSISLVLEDTSQAGSKGILVTNASFSNNKIADTVYYSIYVNDILKKTADSIKKIVLKDTSLLNNKYVFPVSSLELKVSWVKTTAIPDNQISNYYTSEAYIKSTGEKTTVALLGMHVIGVVKNHPEFIWATFEHSNITPLYDWVNTTNKDLPVTSSNEKLFFKQGDSATIKDISWGATSTAVGKNIFSVYKYGVPRVPGNGFMKTFQKEPENYNNIDSINICVANHLKDVWNNYFYNGSVWLNTDGMTPDQQANKLVELANNIGNVAKDSLLRGSTGLSNNTMETYTQIFNPDIHSTTTATLANCFSCHTAAATIKLPTSSNSYNSPLYISHIFRSSLSKSSGISVNEIEAVRLHEFMSIYSTE